MSKCTSQIPQSCTNQILCLYWKIENKEAISISTHRAIFPILQPALSALDSIQYGKPESFQVILQVLFVPPPNQLRGNICFYPAFLHNDEWRGNWFTYV